MGDKTCDETSSSTQVGNDNEDATIMINVKTLDSQVFPFRASKNMTVVMLKEKIADVIGTPIAQQRLIFRGKVLKDDHSLSSYHTEDGDTFHLVARQPVQNENQQGTSAAAASGNAETTGTRNRSGVVGQYSHNVVYGLNSVSVVSEGPNPTAADVNQAIRSLVNSMGLATPTENAASSGNPTSANITVTSSATTTSENQLPTAANIFPFSLFNQHLLANPSSLITMSSFIRHLEQALELYGYESHGPEQENPLRLLTSSSNSRLLRPESLSVVMSQAQRLLHDQVASALSHIAGLLERQASVSDPSLRSEIQNQSTYVGVALQHLGAMLLELGRTTLALRIGESPAESFVSAGPAVYISAGGPSPIMVQPALHTTPLYGFSRNFPLAVNTVNVATAVRPTEREGPDGGSTPLQSTTGETNQSTQPPDLSGNISGQSDTKTEAETSAPLPASAASEEGGRTAGGEKEKKTAPLGLGLGGLQPKRRVKQPESQSKSKSIAMGQQVLQSLAEAGGSSGSSSQSRGSSEGIDFSRLFNQMMPIMSQALGVVGSAGGTHSSDAPHQANLGEEGITQVDVGRVLEGLVNGDSRGRVFRAMVEAASRVYRDSGGDSSEELEEALHGNNELSDDFFEMLRRGGAGSGGS